MKFPLFRRKKFIIAYVIIIALILGSPYIGLLIPWIDLDNDNHFSSWITDVTFIEKIYGGEYGSDISFNIELEIWNPGPFRVNFRSSYGGFGFPYTITQLENSTHQIQEYGISQNDAGVLFLSSRSFFPGVHEFNWTGFISINNSEPYDNQFLPDGFYIFKFGNSQWISQYEYNFSVNSSEMQHFSYPKPENWGEVKLNLGNPYWYILPFVFISLFTAEIILNIREEKNQKQNQPSQ
ncbi:MAG: hypothetical protein JW776_04445 [Candidatus Lokiarchaeota archaeon]|nr:hypothetical protein [Candidatus Lokiarchaeota archaeon]